MKIAFVGKGGSGKSTVSTQFFQYLMKQKKTAVFIDADLNVHAPDLIGVPVDSARHLALANNARNIRRFLMGKSTKIASVDDFYATTPPSQGVNLFQITPDNQLIKQYFSCFGTGFVGVVGTYKKEEVGMSCYHDSLSVLENMLSFSKLEHDEYIVVDMVAGIDAFANSLYMQFDVLVLVVEPTREGIDVYKQYVELARHAGIEQKIRVLANKLEDVDDDDFIRESINPAHLAGTLQRNAQIKKVRQQDTQLPLLFDVTSFKTLMLHQHAPLRSDGDYLKQLNDLHKKFVKQEYVVSVAGDLSGQIDEDFCY